jgi:site-specific DNA recombinase
VAGRANDLGDDLLAGWLEATQPRRRAEHRMEVAGGVRFAFYGRVSTTRFQDRASSTGWQRDFALDLIRGHGRIVVEYFDTGCTRRRPWAHRPRASALLAALADPDRGFDAVVVGEYERAFCGDQLATLAPVLQRYGVSLWLPEAGGPVDFADPAHRALVTMLGAQSRREVLRARWRGGTGHPTGTSCLTPDHTPTAPMPDGGDGCTS